MLLNKNYWCTLNRSKNKLDGYREHIEMESCKPVLFHTKKEALKHIKENYQEYKRNDLRAEPHGWLMPIPIKIKLTIERAK
ncbi:MAG: hypothetical protein ABIJ97_03145 [Bacteroidota bacterium]